MKTKINTTHQIEIELEAEVDSGSPAKITSDPGTSYPEEPAFFEIHKAFAVFEMCGVKIRAELPSELVEKMEGEDGFYEMIMQEAQDKAEGERDAAAEAKGEI